ncbi:MAG: hypothetical protein P9X24_17620 [Candidatus Hatepunaea meridiana]|nr:hypothetical protein [Candidatus Hatepunaea meridiana]
MSDRKPTFIRILILFCHSREGWNPGETTDYLDSSLRGNDKRGIFGQTLFNQTEMPIRRLTLTTILLILTVQPALPRYFLVPNDYETIQSGITNIEDGETLFVRPGVYTENINFDGQEVVVASLAMYFNDDAYIDSTVIDGDNWGSVVSFSLGESRSAFLYGFTIRNGNTESGGGIYVLNDSQPTLSKLKICNNEAERYGGGIYCLNGHPIISDVIIYDNTASKCSKSTKMVYIK